jgi:putative ATP-dependent endonuclease of OLD family
MHNRFEVMSAKPEETKTRLVASLPNFEEAYFGKATKEEKPYNALKTLETDDDKFKIVESLLQALISFKQPLPKKCMEWTSIEELEKALKENIKC